MAPACDGGLGPSLPFSYDKWKWIECKITDDMEHVTTDDGPDAFNEASYGCDMVPDWNASRCNVEDGTDMWPVTMTKKLPREHVAVIGKLVQEFEKEKLQVGSGWERVCWRL